jgi:hypothetical protein
VGKAPTRRPALASITSFFSIYVLCQLHCLPVSLPACLLPACLPGVSSCRHPAGSHPSETSNCVTETLCFGTTPPSSSFLPLPLVACKNNQASPAFPIRSKINTSLRIVTQPPEIS